MTLGAVVPRLEPAKWIQMGGNEVGCKKKEFISKIKTQLLL